MARSWDAAVGCDHVQSESQEGTKSLIVPSETVRSTMQDNCELEYIKHISGEETYFTCEV